MNHKTIETGPSLEGFIAYLGDHSGALGICLLIAIGVSIAWASWASKKL